MSPDRSRPTRLHGPPARDPGRRHVWAGLAALGAAALFAGITILPPSDHEKGSTVPPGVVVVAPPRERPVTNLDPVRKQAPSSPPPGEPLPADLHRHVATALGAAQVELLDVRRSRKRDDAFCGEMATAAHPVRRRFVLLEQPIMLAVDDGDHGFADVALLCDA